VLGLMFRFRVTPDGGQPFEATALSRDVVRWEALPAGPGRSRFVGQLQATPRMTDLAELAWCASVRQELTELSLKDFLKSVDVTPLPTEEEGDGLDPSHPEA
jgi:hypothetical protein